MNKESHSTTSQSPHKETFFVYVLRCSDDSYYVGVTKNLRQRLREHNTGKACEYTKKRKPVSLEYYEPRESLEAAMHRERQIKGWSRAKKESLIAGDLDRLKKVSKHRHKN